MYFVLRPVWADPMNQRQPFQQANAAAVHTSDEGVVRHVLEEFDTKRFNLGGGARSERALELHQVQATLERAGIGGSSRLCTRLLSGCVDELVSEANWFSENVSRNPQQKQDEADSCGGPDTPIKEAQLHNVRLP